MLLSSLASVKAPVVFQDGLEVGSGVVRERSFVTVSTLVSSSVG